MPRTGFVVGEDVCGTPTVVAGSADRDASGASAPGPSAIDEMLREGVRRMLAEALRAEVDADIARYAGSPAHRR
jgi:hypothetical protein